MFIRPMSDLHLEFDDSKLWVLPHVDGEQNMVLILAGDITANHSQWKDTPDDVYSQWIKDVCARHMAVIYIKGNHEDYAGDMCQTETYWHVMSKHIENLHFLNRQSVVIDGVRFLGCTLWTPLDDPLDAFIAQRMNDFRMIKVDGGLLTVNHWQLMNRECVYFLETELNTEFTGNTVVVTHHAPSFKSVADRFHNDKMNACYYNDLDRLMWNFPIKLWIHGHTHDSMDYIVGDETQATRVICNPRGYAIVDENRHFNPLLTVEI